MRVRCLCLALALVLAAFAGVPAQAGSGRALGSVVQSNNSMINNETAMAGADVYACDVLDTDSYGNMRVQFNGSQILLAPSSEVVLDGRPGAARVIVVSGVTSFSAPSSAVLEIDTPAGVLRESAGQAYSGTVSITGPKQLIVSAVRGDLVLNNGGERVADASCHQPGYVRNAYDRRKIRFLILGGAAAGTAGYFTWQEMTESPTKPE